MFFLITIVLVMVFLFTTQVGTLRIVKEGNNAYYAAQSGVEHARNEIIYNTTLHKVICRYNCHLNIPPDCPRQLKVIPKTYLTTYILNDTSYIVPYWFTCYYTVTDILIPPYFRRNFYLLDYQITSWGTFGDAKREIIVTRDQL